MAVNTTLEDGNEPHLAGVQEALAAVPRPGTEELSDALHTISLSNPRLLREQERIGQFVLAAVGILSQGWNPYVGESRAHTATGYVSDTQAKILALLGFCDREISFEKLPQRAMVAALSLAVRDGMIRNRLLPSFEEYGRRASLSLRLSDELMLEDVCRAQAITSTLVGSVGLQQVLRKDGAARARPSSKVLQELAAATLAIVCDKYELAQPELRFERLESGDREIVTFGRFFGAEYRIAVDLANISEHCQGLSPVHEVINTTLHETRHAIQAVMADAYLHASIESGWHTAYRHSRGFELARLYPGDAQTLHLAGKLSADGEAGAIITPPNVPCGAYALYRSVLWESDARRFSNQLYAELARMLNWPSEPPRIILAPRNETTPNGLVLPTNLDTLLYSPPNGLWFPDVE